MTESFDLFIITGKSGAGKTVTMKPFEEICYY
ncbi:RNase adapter RapZ [Lacticaseibacillus rhamnosus]